MSRLFWCGYLTAHYSMVAGKYFRNAERCQKYCPNAENRLILNPQQGKNGGFDYYKESLTSMSNSILLWQCWEKQIYIWRLMKNQ